MSKWLQNIYEKFSYNPNHHLKYFGFFFTIVLLQMLLYASAKNNHIYGK